MCGATVFEQVFMGVFFVGQEREKIQKSVGTICCEEDHKHHNSSTLQSPHQIKGNESCKGC